MFFGINDIHHTYRLKDPSAANAVIFDGYKGLLDEVLIGYVQEAAFRFDMLNLSLALPHGSTNISIFECPSY